MANPRFNTYDPAIRRPGGSMYDPTLGRRNNAGSIMQPGSEIQAASPNNNMQINLEFNNATASNLTIEAFSFLKSMVRFQKLQYQVANYLYIPQTGYEGLLAINAGTNQTVGFNSLGNLVVRGLLVDPVATLSCKEFPYASLFEASRDGFNVAYMRYKASNDAQIDEPIVWFQDTFSGGELVNKINPRAYQLPSNEIDTLIDIPMSFPIAADKGIKMTILAGQYVKLALFINSWTSQNV